MPFGVKNVPATFQRMVNHIVADIEGFEAYVDDLIVYTQTWEQHIGQLRRLFEKLSQAKLTVNLVKSEFCQANVVYLGHVVDQGTVKPIKVQVEVIEKFPTPRTKKELQRFLGMAGYLLYEVLSEFSWCGQSTDKFVGKECQICLVRGNWKWFQQNQSHTN